MGNQFLMFDLGKVKKCQNVNSLRFLLTPLSCFRHELNQPKLESYLLKRIPGFTAPLQISQFQLGQSNPTYLLKDGK
jgi:hypothetical protein